MHFDLLDDVAQVLTYSILEINDDRNAKRKKTEGKIPKKLTNRNCDLKGLTEKNTSFTQYTHCLKITQKVAFEFWHFPPIFVQLKLTCLVTLFDRKLQVFKNSPKWNFFDIFNQLLSAQNVAFEFLNFGIFHQFLSN